MSSTQTIATASATATTASASASTTNGRVKWFNNKAGYGFITVQDCETGEDRDIFVHHSAIVVATSQYKYLVQGEYVDFTISVVENDKHVFQASAVQGVNGGKLMCETRNESRSARTEQGPVQRKTAPASHASASTQYAPTPTQYVPTQEFKQPPQLGKADQEEWMVVPRRRTQTQGGGKQETSKPQSRPPRTKTTKSSQGLSA